MRAWVNRLTLSPVGLRRLHGIATLGWFVMIPVSIATGLRNSLPYLVGLSVYALFVSHFGAWQASRAETNGT